MKHAHRISGLLVSVFVAAHLSNHALAWFGIETHQAVLEALRKVYRQPVVEVLLVAAFGFQAISGLLLFLRGRKRTDLSQTEQIKRYAGLTLGLFLIQHIPATIGQRLYYQVDTNFYFAAQVVLEAPAKYYFRPYYFLGIMAVGIHVAAVHRNKISRRIGKKQANLHAGIIALVFLLLACVILFTFTGGRFPIS
ncbi:MAG: hypothetical protein AAF399_18785 [Bacteroidota bacterium]